MNNKEKIEIIQAFDEGKEIEIKLKQGFKWHKHPNPNFGFPDFNFVDYEYRIKPEPKKKGYRPLAGKELLSLRGKWLRHKTEENDYFLITLIDTFQDIVKANCRCYNSLELLEQFTDEDGNPIGVEL